MSVPLLNKENLIRDIKELKVGKCILAFTLHRGGVLCTVYHRCKDCGKIEKERFLLENESYRMYIQYIVSRFDVQENINDLTNKISKMLCSSL